MKWVGAFIAGLLAGGIAALALLFVNPFSGERLAAAESTSLLSYEFGPSTLSLTHGGQLGFELQPGDVPTLWETTIRRTMLGTFVLRDLQGNAVGVASRSMRISADSNFLTNGLLTADHWLVTLPGVGSYFIEANDNVWPLLRDTWVKVNLLGRDWTGPRHFELSVGPSSNGAARLTGTSGRFAGVAGTAVHSVDIDRYQNMSQLASPTTGQLRLDVRRPQQTATAQ